VAADALSHLSALDNKAYDLSMKRRHARCAAIRGEAVAAAQALNNADCIITAALQMEEAAALLSHTCAPGVLQADAHAARERVRQLLRAALPTLQRRKAAGTLLPGAVRAIAVAVVPCRCHLPVTKRAWSRQGWRLNGV
jgi:hypothetical protein